MSPYDLNRSHGTYDIQAFGSLLRIRAAGGWNEVTARRFSREYRDRISALPDGPWGAYIDLRHWGLAVPDAIAHLNDLGSWTAPQGRGTHMFLFNGMSIQESMIAGILNVASHDSYFFTTVHEAGDWLRQREFCIGEIGKITEPVILD